MEELLRRINETFDNCIENSNEDTKLQLKIVKNNVNALFNEYINGTLVEENVATKTSETNVLEAYNQNIDVTSTPTVQPTFASTTIQPIEEPLADKKSILIVDDSSIVRNYLEKVFNEEYNVLLATDGQDAIEQLSSDEFTKDLSLILLDLMMPNIDGFGVLEYLTGKNINIPIMIISGDNSKETINRAFQYNVVDVIEKPFDAKKIKEKMERFINL